MATIITSRKAKKDLEKIKGHHAELLKGLQAHQDRVRMFREQQSVQGRQKSQEDREYGQKNVEMDIKRAEIASKPL